eukprot:2495176-Rhodomonas_salina.1
MVGTAKYYRAKDVSIWDGYAADAGSFLQDTLFRFSKWVPQEGRSRIGGYLKQAVALRTSAKLTFKGARVKAARFIRPSAKLHACKSLRGVPVGFHGPGAAVRGVTRGVAREAEVG